MVSHRVLLSKHFVMCIFTGRTMVSDIIQKLNGCTESSVLVDFQVRQVCVSHSFGVQAGAP